MKTKGEFFLEVRDCWCTDPCCIETLTKRREQYKEFALCDLAARRDPQVREDFVPGKSRMGRPKARVDER